MKLKLSKRDILVILLVIVGVVGSWFVLVYALLHLVIAGFIVPAWIILVAITFWALRRRK